MSDDLRQQSPRDESGANLISHDLARRLAEARLTEARLDHVTRRLNQLTEPSSGSERFGQQIEDLRKQRDDLLQHPRPGSVRLDVERADLIHHLIPDLGPFFSPWNELRLPYLAEGQHVTPGAPGTSGDIATAGLYAGGLGFGGAPSAVSSTEQWWVHNWTCSAVFPTATFSGRLYYRFTVDTSCLIYSAPVQSGEVREFVTIGTTPDINAHSPFADSDLETVGWPIVQFLPHGTPIFFDHVSLPVSGSIHVQAGKTAALAFIYGIIVGVSNGYVQFGWGSIGTRTTLPPNTSYDGEVFDKIEYRFEPDWWIKSVAERFTLTLPTP